MVNRRLIELELPPVRLASQEGLDRFTGGTGSLHRRGWRTTLGRGGGSVVGVSVVGRREKRNYGKEWARSMMWSSLDTALTNIRYNANDGEPRSKNEKGKPASMRKLTEDDC